jgi:flagella basal body P-ring formation protein FlgA
MLNRNTGFILGNVLGLTILIAGIMITAPQKKAEQAEIDRRNSEAVVVAVSDIQAATRISMDLIKESRKPHDEVPLNAVPAAKKIVGLLTKSEIKKGEVVTYSALDLRSKSE